MRETPKLMRRMLALRQFPMFAHAEIGELATVAENVVERAFRPGDVVAPADHLTGLHLILEGGLEVGAARLEPRQVHGALEIAADRPACAPAIAIAPTRTLVLDASDYFEVLEDNFGLLLATIRDLAARVIPLDLPHRPPVHFTSDPLGLVERMILLRQLAPFESARLEALAILAHAAAEKRWPAGTVIRRADARADGALILVDGTLRGEREHGPGQAVGLYETLAGLHHRANLEALTPVRALVTNAATILDVIEDHTDLALAMVQTFARVLVDHEARMACASGAGDAETAGDPSPPASHGWRTS